MSNEFEYEQSSTFVLKDGRYFLEERQSQIFSTIMREHPHFSTEYRWDEMSLGELFVVLGYRFLIVSRIILGDFVTVQIEEFGKLFHIATHDD